MVSVDIVFVAVKLLDCCKTALLYCKLFYGKYSTWRLSAECPFMKLLLSFYLITILACNQGIDYPAGGYNYPAIINSKDSNFYYYPLKNNLSRKDSFLYGGERLFFQAFDEPNLSLRPLVKEEFRLAYSCWICKTYMIVLKADSLTIKSGHNSNAYIQTDSLLTKIEKLQLDILRRWYPLDDSTRDAGKRHYLDSLLHLYPQLRDPAYYQYLENRSYARDRQFTYEQTSRPVRKDSFNYFIQQINNAGFWKMPFLVGCKEYGADGSDGIILEANTKYKYQVTRVDLCADSIDAISKACQFLINYAGLGKEIRLVRQQGAHNIIVKDVPLQEIKPEKHKKKRHRSSSK
jgi:hypothetical protein